jgi:hypothetical protein
VLEAANAAAQVGDHDLVRRIAEHMLRQWPDDVDGTRILAGAALDRGDTALARDVLARGLRYHPDDELLRRMNAAAHDSTP